MRQDQLLRRAANLCLQWQLAPHLVGLTVWQHDIITGQKIQIQGPLPPALHPLAAHLRLDLDPDADCDEVAFETSLDEEDVPRRFWGALALGAKEAALQGPLAGYPVIGARVTCREGQYDMLCSTEDHFHKAGAAAMREAGTGLKSAWRTQITGAGLGRRLANSIRNQNFPKSGESLDAAARAAIDPDRFVWVIVGDASVVEPQLEQLGLAVERVEMAGTE